MDEMTIAKYLSEIDCLKIRINRRDKEISEYKKGIDRIQQALEAQTIVFEDLKLISGMFR